MAGVITKRSEEEVTEWVIERIDKYQLDSEDRQHIDSLDDLRDAIKFNPMLTKTQARLLEKLLSEDASEVLGRGNDSYHTAIQYIDRLSIYTDVWQMYCKQGTYSL
mgnify:FL=1